MKRSLAATLSITFYNVIFCISSALFADTNIGDLAQINIYGLCAHENIYATAKLPLINSSLSEKA